MKKIRHILEVILLLPFLAFFRILPFDVASAFGGFLARTFGPLTKAHKVARTNLKMIFPDKPESEIKEILTGMWDNLGRIAGELPKAKSFSSNDFKERVKIKNLPKDTKKSILFISAHFGNFELAARTFHEMGVKTNLVYRPANNPYTDYLINGGRRLDGIRLVPKGNAGIKQLLHAISEGESIGIMIDQKNNKGIEVPFMGHMAKTAPFAANLATKYGLPVIFIKFGRKKGANFEVELSDEVRYSPKQRIEEIIQNMGDVWAEWIKKDPKQWFWVHKRWGKL